MVFQIIFSLRLGCVTLQAKNKYISEFLEDATRYLSNRSRGRVSALDFCGVERATHLQRKASHAHNPIWRKCAVNSLDQWGALGCHKWVIIVLKYLLTKAFILCFDSWDKIQPMSSKVGNRETVNEGRASFIFWRSRHLPQAKLYLCVSWHLFQRLYY